jgi:hypothetical protein
MAKAKAKKPRKTYTLLADLVRPKWCEPCGAQITTASAHCPQCLTIFRMHTKPDQLDTAGQWHAASVSDQVVGDLYTTICPMINRELAKRGIATVSVWFNAELIAIVRRVPTGTTEIAYNTEHTSWNTLNTTLKAAMIESGLATA